MNIILPKRANCCECNKSLICKHCGMFKWNSIHIIDNAVSPWYFCSKECKEKFQAKLKEKLKR